MLTTIYLVPLVPLAAAVINLFFGKRLGPKAAWLACAAMLVAFAMACVALAQLLALPVTERTVVTELYQWFSAGTFSVDVAFRLDQLSMTMLMVVTGVGSLIHLYSIGYMKDDPRYGRFFAYLNLFVAFMLILVLADNYLLLYLGWEGVGLCSYLLIGFWFEKKSAGNAAKKAFVVTRIGDTLMLIGLALMVLQVGSLGFSEVLGGGAKTLSEGTATVIALLLFCGAVGKSAQLPLHVWLPDAMEGPTPVSALIHAATMVTAGVYLLARSHVLLTETALDVVLIIGLATALYAALCAIAQDDLKRTLAYSTISQLGYMFFAIGLKEYSLAIVLLVMHACYKGLMFLGAGSVMHGLGGETDMTKMGGLRKTMPLTGAFFVVGAWSLSGLPPFSGFFSKDPIIAAAAELGDELAWLVASVAAFLSALYIGRLLFLTFFGTYRGDKHPHESPKIMTIPMGILAFLAAVGGLLTLSPKTGELEDWLRPVFGHEPEVHEGFLSESSLTSISVLIALAGAILAWYWFASGKVAWQERRARHPRTRAFLASGMGIDEGYRRVIAAPGRLVAVFLTAFDANVVDGAANGVGKLSVLVAVVGRRLQTGFVRTYALGVALGAFGLLLWLAVRA